MNGEGANVQRMATSQAAALIGTHRAVRGRASTSHCANGMLTSSSTAPVPTRRRTGGDARSTPRVLGSMPRVHAIAAATAVAPDPTPCRWTVDAHPRVLADREGRPLHGPGRDHQHEARRIVEAGDDRQDGHAGGDGEARGLADRDGDDPAQCATIVPAVRCTRSDTADLADHSFVHGSTLGEARRDPGDLRPVPRPCARRF